MPKYVAFYRGRQCDVTADTSYAAQTKAAQIFRARKPYDVTVVIAEQDDGTPVVHIPLD